MGGREEGRKGGWEEGRMEGRMGGWGDGGIFIYVVLCCMWGMWGVDDLFVALFVDFFF